MIKKKNNDRLQFGNFADSDSCVIFLLSSVFCLILIIGFIESQVWKFLRVQCILDRGSFSVFYLQTHNCILWYYRNKQKKDFFRDINLLFNHVICDFFCINKFYIFEIIKNIVSYPTFKKICDFTNTYKFHKSNMTEKYCQQKYLTDKSKTQSKIPAIT